MIIFALALTTLSTLLLLMVCGRQFKRLIRAQLSIIDLMDRLARVRELYVEARHRERLWEHRFKVAVREEDVILGAEILEEK